MPAEADPSPRQWVDISDFRPGIHAVSSPNLPRGAATVANTYRCMADDSGSLIAAPRHVETVAMDPPEGANAITSEKYRLTGIACVDPVYTPDNTQWGVDQNNTDVWVGMEWYYDSQVHRRVSRWLRHRLDPSWSDVSTVSKDAEFDPNSRPKKCYFATGRSNSAAPTQVGPAVIGWVFGGTAKFFPDDTDTDSTSAVALPGEDVALVWPDALVGHQGRAVILPLTISNHGQAEGDAIVYTTNEAIYWTEPNDWTTLEANLAGAYFNFIVGYENPTGYSAIASLSAGELFMVKARGGAIMVRGDLDDPQAVTLPNVRSAGQSLDLGTSTPIGYLYPVDSSGVWLWEGGDSSRPVATQLAADFFRPEPADGEDWGYSFTQSTSWGELAMFGNNWFFDTTNPVTADGTPAGWWRLEDPDLKTLHMYATDWKGRLCWAIPGGFVDSGDAAMWAFDSRLRAQSYSWQSQPIELGIEQTFNTEDVLVCASGQGTVQVTFTSPDTGTVETRRFAFTESDLPVTKRVKLAARGTHTQVRIESFGDEGADFVAPTVHSVRFSYYPVNPIGQEEVP